MRDEAIFNGKPITELCQWGQDKVVVYSEDKAIYDKFSQDPRCIKASPYFSHEGHKFLAGDVLFLKGYKDCLERKLRKLKK